MLEDDFLEGWQKWLGEQGWQHDEGEEFRDPALDILGYGVKRIRLNRIPWFGRGLAVIAICRHPFDLRSDATGLRQWSDRLARAVNGRFPPWKIRRPGAILLIAVQLTPEPIRDEDEERLKSVLGHWTGTRVVPAAAVRINLGQGAMASILAEGLPRDLPEIGQLLDTWAAKFQRFVPMWNESEIL
ncbi:MAG: hypothetical protein WCJ40_06885 [Planctomycetota bacterium]|nr:hypothetical protein [Planctomycetota bacterium]RLT09608.1 MAG: hypothetical protein DWI24_09685 [Planctomycetota bacterium]